MTECRSCAAPLTWAVMSSGQLCPFDREPSPQGGWRLLSEEDGRDHAVYVRPEDRGPEMRLYTSHFATCPHARGWRRKK